MVYCEKRENEREETVLETMAGANNWKLTVRREAAGVTVLRAVTCDAAAALPDTLWGLPVTALGDHALAPGAAAVPGEAVEITCGAPAGAEWDNRRLEALTLPPALERIGDYAFLNCAALERLDLYDTIRQWGGGALMNCRSLRIFRLTRPGAEGDTLAYFADELSRELDVTLAGPEGVAARLIFPEYRELYEENCPAHHFDYNISGAGYPYHHCFVRRRLDLRNYDRLWKPFLGMEHEADCALRLAFWRLRYPLDLTPEAEADYLAYLRAQAEAALAWLVTERDAESLRIFLERVKPGPEALSEGCALARELGAAEALALLLEARHRAGAGVRRRFDL